MHNVRIDQHDDDYGSSASKELAESIRADFQLLSQMFARLGHYGDAADDKTAEGIARVQASIDRGLELIDVIIQQQS